MDVERARTLLHNERARVEELLAATTDAGGFNRREALETGDLTDPAQPLAQEEVDDAVAAGLRERLAAVERAEGRIDAGTYGLSTRSGLPIPDDRLEADPAAELTMEEARDS